MFVFRRDAKKNALATLLVPISTRKTEKSCCFAFRPAETITTLLVMLFAVQNSFGRMQLPANDFAFMNDSCHAIARDWLLLLQTTLTNTVNSLLDEVEDSIAVIEITFRNSNFNCRLEDQVFSKRLCLT